ncbi:MAG: DNA polymerase I [Candidatus Krumholzibacteria bacterium]|nr:DNA polymerase I [Candidatus Krumholzibacteria bacterium]
MKRTLFLIDGHAIAYRAYYAFIRNPLIDSKGRNTSAAFGFLRVVLQILQRYHPTLMACVFDSEEETDRHREYGGYKAQREEMPDEMADQFPLIFELLEALGIPVAVMPGYEADDIIATLARRAEASGDDVRIVSGDKDLFQLLSDRVRVIRPSSGSGIDEDEGPEMVRAKYGLEPGQIVDLLSLMGDSVDNIPGVRGIGEKTALKLMHEFGSLDAILERSAEIAPDHVRRKIEEGRESALRSRELVTLREVPVTISPEDLEIGRPDEDRLLDLLVDLEFTQIVKELGIGTGKSAGTPPYRLVDGGGLGDLVRVLSGSGGFVFDVETTSLDPLEARLVGISFAVEEGGAWYVPVGTGESGEGLFAESGASAPDLPAVREALGPVLADERIEKTGHNVKYDLLVLESHGFEVRGVGWDTMIASYCLDPSRRSHSLDNLALDHFRHRMIPYGDLFEKGDRVRDIRRVALDRLCEYSCEDADYTLRLRRLFEPQLEGTEAGTLFREIEMPLCFVLKRMEQSGMAVDTSRLADLGSVIAGEIERLTARIYEAAGETFNINSGRQLQEVLFDKLGLPAGRKTKTGRSTDSQVLGELAVDHPIAGLILEHRQLTKLSGTYVEALPRLVNPRTGRIHTSFNQTVTATGRLSSSEPNLQNIPIRTELGKSIRRAFVPAPGNVLVDADYSQIELRIMAHLSRDEGLCGAFGEGADIHTRTASRIYRVPEERVRPQMRASAKTINFGVMYGQGPRALSQQLRIPFDEAKRFIEEYFETYPGVRAWIERAQEEARGNGYAQTLFGRRRPLPEIASEDGRLRSLSERIAVNMPIQGTAADLIKIAMIEIDRELSARRFGTRMVLQVHDELVFDVPRAERDDVIALVRERMEAAVRLDVPLKVDIGYGGDWLEAH